MDFLLSIIYTLAVTLLPYIITFFITKKKQLTLKTTKILTIIFSIISFAVFCVIGFLSGQSGISVVPVVIWNGVGYLIIRKNIKQSNNTEDTEPAATCNEETDIENYKETSNTHIVKVKIKSTNKLDTKTKNTKKSKNKSKTAIIILSVLTAIFAASTIILTICLINTTTEINEANSKISELNKQNEELIKEKKELQHDYIEDLEQQLFGEPTTSRLEELRKNKGKYELVTEAGSEEEAGKKYWAEHYTKP